MEFDNCVWPNQLDDKKRFICAVCVQRLASRLHKIQTPTTANRQRYLLVHMRSSKENIKNLSVCSPPGKVTITTSERMCRPRVRLSWPPALGAFSFAD